MGIAPSGGNITNCFVKGNMTCERDIYGISTSATLTNSGINARMIVSGDSGSIFGMRVILIYSSC